MPTPTTEMKKQDQDVVLEGIVDDFELEEVTDIAVSENQDVSQVTHEINGQKYYKFDFTGGGMIQFPLSKDGQTPFGFMQLELDWKKTKSQPFIDALSASVTRKTNLEKDTKMSERQVSNATTMFAKLGREICVSAATAEPTEDLTDLEYKPLSMAQLKNEVPEEWLATGVMKFFRGINFKPYFEKGVTQLQAFLDKTKQNEIQLLATIPSGMEHDYGFILTMASPSKDARRTYDEKTQKTYDEQDGANLTEIREVDFGYKMRFGKKYLIDVTPVTLNGNACDYTKAEDKEKFNIYFPPIWFARLADALVNYFDIEGK